MVKTYEVTFKYSDVTEMIEAENEDEALKKADELNQSRNDDNPKNSTYCYETEAEEIYEDI